MLSSLRRLKRHWLFLVPFYLFLCSCQTKFVPYPSYQPEPGAKLSSDFQAQIRELSTSVRPYKLLSQLTVETSSEKQRFRTLLQTSLQEDAQVELLPVTSTYPLASYALKGQVLKYLDYQTGKTKLLDWETSQLRRYLKTPALKDLDFLFFILGRLPTRFLRELIPKRIAAVKEGSDTLEIFDIKKEFHLVFDQRTGLLKKARFWDVFQERLQIAASYNEYIEMSGQPVPKLVNLELADHDIEVEIEIKNRSLKVIN